MLLRIQKSNFHYTECFQWRQLTWDLVYPLRIHNSSGKKQQKKPRQVFYEKDVYKNLSRSTEKHLCQSLFALLLQYILLKNAIYSTKVRRFWIVLGRWRKINKKCRFFIRWGCFTDCSSFNTIILVTEQIIVFWLVHKLSPKTR